MFLDDCSVERTENITRRVNQAQKHGEPVIRPDRPWEGGQTYVFGTPMYDDEEKIFKIWYYANGHVGYAVSKDGLAWEKPELDVVVMDGKKTNLVMARGKARDKRGRFGYLFEICSVLKDKKDPDPSRRYKAGLIGIQSNYTGEFGDPYHPGERRGLATAVSPDGIHWTIENDWASYDICDGLSGVLWDDLKGRYVVYGRTKLTPDKNDGRWRIHGWGRAVNRIESQDFREWSKGELVLATDAKDPKGAEIYSLSVLPYEGLYVGFVQIYHGLPDQGNLEIQLAVSRDGRSFARIEPRDPFIPEGRVGDWDRFNISLGMPPVAVGDELWFYYSGRTYRHPPYKEKDSGPKFGCIGLAKIKRGRFVSLEASFDGGTVVTKPLTLNGSTLYLNANAAFGSVEVALLDDRGAPIPGWTGAVRGADSVAVPVAFKPGSLETLAGKPVKIQFTLANAQLFGFRVK